MIEEKKLWREEDDEYFKHISRVIRIENMMKLFKDCTDEIIYLQKELEKKNQELSKFKNNTK